MKKLTCAVLGYGHRGSSYAVYAKTHPEELEVVAIIDPSLLKRNTGKADFNLSEDQLFENLDDFIAKGIKCDFVINGTMDQLHYETTIKLLENKFDILLEKPITGNPEELLHIQRLAEQNNCKVVICHVLRYTLFYSQIKKILDSGELGRVMNIQLNEHVGTPHFIKAFVRGKWRSEKECGSGLLLAKCCHDTDLMCWLNNETEPELVSSFGERAHFTEENAPEGATQYCYQCPRQKECWFDAFKSELEQDTIPFYTWCRIDKPYEEITREEKIEYLKKDIYGQCVYKIKDMDIVDRQCVSVKFKNGSIATLNLVGGVVSANRHLHILCEMGEIVGYIEDNKFKVVKFMGDISHQEQKIIDLDEIQKLEGDGNSITGHYGGDYYIMKDLLKFLRGEPTSSSTTVLNDSINSHLVCYAADKARKESSVVNIDKTYKNKQ